VTGLSWGLPEQAQKVIELQRALMPDMQRTFLIVDGHDGGPLSMIPMFEAAAREAGIQFDPVFARTRTELDRFLSRRTSAIRAGAVTFTAYAVDPADLAQRAIAGRVALLAFRSREWVEAGGAAAHGFFHRHQTRRMASLLAAVLRGVSAGELPFEMPDAEWVGVNRKTCNLLGIAVPPAVIMRAELVVG
jgi:putative ABC transport system substrate-binding protein